MADHRLPLESARIGQFACQLGRRLGLPIAATGDTDPQYARWLDALVEGLRAQHGSALIVIGAAQPPWMHDNQLYRAGGKSCQARLACSQVS